MRAIPLGITACFDLLVNPGMDNVIDNLVQEDDVRWVHDSCSGIRLRAWRDHCHTRKQGVRKHA